MAEGDEDAVLQPTHARALLERSLEALRKLEREYEAIRAQNVQLREEIKARTTTSRSWGRAPGSPRRSPR